MDTKKKINSWIILVLITIITLLFFSCRDDTTADDSNNTGTGAGDFLKLFVDKVVWLSEACTKPAQSNNYLHIAAKTVFSTEHLLMN